MTFEEKVDALGHELTHGVVDFSDQEYDFINNMVELVECCHEPSEKQVKWIEDLYEKRIYRGESA